MAGDDLSRVAGLLTKRNAIDAELAGIIQRPITAGHLGEWIAARVFQIELEDSAIAPGFDGRFRTGSLADRTVNVKWYLKREGILDVSSSEHLDYYLALTGPQAPATSSRGSVRPWRIDAAYLFDARELKSQLESGHLKIGIATSVRTSLWEASEIFPRSQSPYLTLTDEQRHQLQLFSA